jgi:hypothetical protein
MKRLFGLLLFFVSFAVGAELQPITPVFQGSKTISCTSASAATALPTTIAQQAQIELQNAGTAVIFVETGDSTAAAAVATGYPILVGQSKVISVSPGITHIACIVSASTHTLYVTIGRGN